MSAVRNYGLIIANLKLFADNHLAIKRFKSTYLSNIESFSEEGRIFPIFYVTPSSIVNRVYTNKYSFRVYCLDKLRLDRANEIDIHNQTQSILQDLCIWLRQSDNLLSLSNEPYFIPCETFLNDGLAGWYVDIEVESGAFSTDCSIPFSEDFLNTPSGINCDYQLVSKYLTCETLAECSTIVNLQNGKVDKIEGKSLSTNDFTQQLLEKLNAIESGAQVNKIEVIKVNGTEQTIADKTVDISIPAPIFEQDINVVLPSNQSIGKYVNGDTIPAAGKTFEEVIRDIAIAYINPSFNSFLITGQLNTVEVGTILSGNKTFVWSISNNSGIVNTVDIFDNTINALILNTPNDGSQIVSINTNNLFNEGDTQSWKIIAKNTSPTGNINSSNFIVTSRYKIFYGPTSTTPASSTDIRGLANNTFKNVGSNVVDLITGITYNKFVIALPPSKIITSVIDLGNLNANITSDYILTTLNVEDANGTSRLYNIYQLTLGSPYSISTTHRITTN